MGQISTGPYGFLALHLACFNGHLSAVQILLEKGSDINSLSKAGCLPFQLACARGHLLVAQMLFDLGADITDLVH
jgi:ankyrin repeat protein